MYQIVCEYCKRPNAHDAGECQRCGAPLLNVQYVPKVSEPFFVLKSDRALSAEESCRIREYWKSLFSDVDYKLVILDRGLQLGIYSIDEVRKMHGTQTIE